MKFLESGEKPVYLERPSDEKTTKGSLPLTWNEDLLEAIKHDRLEQVKELLASTKWDPNGPYVPVAAHWGHVTMVEELCTAKANMDAMLWGKPAIMLAAESAHLECVECICKHGGSKDALDLDGETALSRAENYGHKDVCVFLRDVGAKEFSLRGMLKKRDILAVHVWVANAALEEGGSIEERDRRMALVDEVASYAPLEVRFLLAAQRGDLAEVKRLVEDEAVEPETRSADGKTALEIAARENHRPVVQFLSLFADHGQVKAILEGLRPAPPAGKKGLKGKRSKSNKGGKNKRASDFASAEGGDAPTPA